MKELEPNQLEQLPAEQQQTLIEFLSNCLSAVHNGEDLKVLVIDDEDTPVSEEEIDELRWLVTRLEILDE